jgi:putative spermidine/putrescine transport system substrate-binding protein
MRFSRRAVGMTCALVAAAIVVAVGIGSAQEMAKRFVFGSPGGVSTEANQEIFWKPFTARTGIEIIAEVPSSFGKLRAMVQSGKVTASLWDLGTLQLEQAKALDLIEPIDWDQISPGPMFPEMRQQYGFGQTYFSTVMAWRADVKAPQSWQDFWNVKDFPGKRALRKHIDGQLEAALLADGVAPKDLYPIDLKRALNKIKELKPHCIFWSTGAESQQVLRDKEVTMANVWNTRASVLRRESKQKIDFHYNEALLWVGAWIVPKDNPAGKDVFKFMASTQDPARQVELFKLLGNGPVNPAAAAMVPDDLKIIDPSSPENYAKQVPVSAEWYAKNSAAALTAYIEAVS